MDEMRVNDGGGLMDNAGLIDSLIIDCNSLMKLLIENQFVMFGSVTAGMVQKLRNLQQGIVNDTQSLEKQLADAKRLNDELAKIAYGGKGEQHADNHT